mmetsp:Transcript_30205/g.89904  ORF Transcript_30205/g.89904 Transcript_30205/m.89904 type:complete len:116 (+) Transcript_30205:1318-1665(+)
MLDGKWDEEEEATPRFNFFTIGETESQSTEDNIFCGFLKDEVVVENAYVVEEYEGFVSLNNEHHGVKRTWILLENKSTVNIFCNRKLLTDIRKVPASMRIKLNAGTLVTDMMGTL